MKAISLWQPWATLIAIGAKSIETRGWPTDYRGWLAIHAAKKWNKELNAMCGRAPFFQALTAANYRRGVVSDQWHLPLGAIVGVCKVIQNVSTNLTFDLAFEVNGKTKRWQLPPPSPERDFGDYSPNRYAWLLDQVTAFKEPIPFKGSRTFFEVPDDLIAAAVKGVA